MALKVVLGLKGGKSFQKELSNEEAESLFGKVLGEEINGELLGFSGVKLQITGGSDSSGFPMRRDVSGTGKRKILTTKSLGFRGKLRGKRFDGVRIKRTVAGNTISEKTHQLNLKVTKGDAVIEKAFAPAPEETASAEGEAPAQEAPAPETKE